ncbi:LysR family transcriptional regulator [Paludibacterium paludis]|uniref:LysR family transcriptional regulator n=1 Tax=Paludibacterium paludis TaxID=1225769 RepID=A0A918U9R2_9NEIS|nr:LysR family transcriptional regulator [Paludibacterium paludis]GGY17349.1 LysR family transcriptional regulator [Paludibacterium paludis]
MDVRQLKAFIAVFEERSITAAAERLFVSQPSLSVTIRQLEVSLGVALFHRLPRGVEVSDAARRLYPGARQLVDQAAALAAQFLPGWERPVVRLGVEGDIAIAHLQAAVNRIVGLMPEVRLLVEEGCCGEIRLGAEASSCEDEWFFALDEEPFVLAVPESDAGMEKTGPWVVCPFHPSHQRLLPLYGDGTVAAEAGNLTIAAKLVACGAGAAFLPRSLIHSLPGVRECPLVGPLPTRRVGLCLPAQASSNPVLGRLRAALGTDCASVFPGG